MKNIKLTLWLALAFLWVIQPIKSQESSQQLSEKIPFDSQVLKGKLDNGLTYYIRQNAKPENKVELRLIINAGSILEDDDQQGLAHFCEHMCFNGTEHFKKNELVNYLQGLGIEFGGDLNAYTSFDETVYMLPIPTENPETVDTGLLVLRDWANGVLFTGEEIDKERGVILEELRIGQGAQQRMRDQYFPKIFKGSQYANRLPIGHKDLLETFEYETIRRFYKEWYRPDLMAVIAIGDLDPQEMKKKIETHFGNIKMPEKYRPRKTFTVPDHQETYVSVVSDKEAQYTLIQLLYKDDTQETNTWADYKRNLAQNLYQGMISARLQELTQSAQPPFMYAAAGYSGLVRTKNAYTSIAVVGPDGIENALKTLLKENQRVKNHGFTQTELDRYKSEYLKNLEQQYNEKDKTESAQYVNEYLNNFLENEPSPGIEAEYKFTRTAIADITLEEVNAFAKDWIKNNNRVVIIMAPEKEGIVLPSETDVKNWLNDADKEKVEAYVDATSDRPLMECPPRPAESRKLKYYRNTDIQEIVFANGLKVVYKPTKFKNDEILVSAYSLGGSSLYNDSEFKSAEMGADLVSQSGLNGFTSIQLNKLLADKNISIYPYIGTLSEGFKGSTTPQDLETLLQLINLYFTSPNFSKQSFTSIINKQKMYIPNLLQDPQTFYRNEVSKIMAQNSPRGSYIPTMKDLDLLNFDIAKRAYCERFDNAEDFTFFFVGNIDMEKALPLMQSYLGSIPGRSIKENYVDLGVRPPKGKLEKTVFKGQDEKSMVNIIYTGDAKVSSKEKHLLQSLGDILTIKLIENLREEKSGVYGVGARGSLSQNPYGHFKFSIGFPCGPDHVDELTAAVYAEIAKIKSEGPTQKDIDKVKEAQRLDLKENYKKNSFWLSSIQNAYFNNMNPEDIMKKQSFINDLSVKSLKKVAKKYLIDENLIQVVLMPDKK